jgi:tRNA dimethylallyltransferase
MFSKGLVAETEALLKHGLENNRTAMQALGYRQVIDHLRGKLTLATTVELVKVRTRQFAKRQMTWFRRQMRLGWKDLHSNRDSKQVAAELLAKIEAEQIRTSIIL